MRHAPRFEDIVSDLDYRAMVDRLREARDNLGLSQADVADKIGVTAVTVGKWERFVHTPSLFHLISWWRVLDFEAQRKQ